MSQFICSRCNKDIAEGKYITIGVAKYHADCFSCEHCKKKIEGNYVDFGETKRPHHPQCVEQVLEQEALQKGKICKKCGKACCSGKFISLTDGEMYHAQCFECGDCGLLISGNYLKYGVDDVPLHPDCYRKREIAKAKSDGRICRKCKKVCFEGRIMTISNGDIYHAECFTCCYCKKAIESQFAQHGEGDLPYHVDCLNELRNNKSADSSASGSLKSSKPTAGSKESTKVIVAPRVCKKCGLVCDVGKFYSTKTNEIYHAECFRCSDPNCNGAISGTYTEHGDPPLPYHPACGKELFAPRCCLCTHTLEGQFYKHPFFETEIYCMSHESLPSCFACSRKQPLPASGRDGFVDLLDGRSLCAQCSSSIIVDSSEAVALYKGIVEFMGRELGLQIPPEMRDVPILLVDFPSLNENRNKLGEVLGYHTDVQAGGVAAAPAVVPTHLPPPSPIKTVTSSLLPTPTSAKDTGGSAASTPAAMSLAQRAAMAATRSNSEGVIRGVTMSTCSKVRYLPSAGLQLDTAGKTLAARLPHPEVYQMKQVRDVSAVLVLYGLPRDLTASILAHEAMHVWLKLNKKFPFRLPPKLEEGLCQVIAHLYLEHLVAAATASASSSADGASETVFNAPAGGSAKLARSPSSSFPAARPLPLPSGPTRSAVSKRPSSVVLKPKSKPKIKTLTRWFSEQIEVDKSPIYGKGFEEVNRAVSVLGLSAVLLYIQKHQCLPPLRGS